ncbi:MAG: ATP12 family chaperone protein [Sphingomonadales bacterium]
MKRFYANAAAREVVGGHEILLDGRSVKTPARAALCVPTRDLAEAIVEEWNSQGETIEPRAMPLTGLANAAIDRVGPERETFAAGLGRYAENDLLCYRAEGPDALAARQAEHWAPLLEWARRRFDVDFEIVEGIVHRPQPGGTIDRLRRAVEASGPFELAGLSPFVTISGSLVIALALAEQAIDLDAAWEAATVDEAWQLEQWGADAEAERVLAARRAEFAAAHRFLELLGQR